MAKLGKRTKSIREAFAGKSNLTVEEAVALVKGNAGAKFDETVEIAMIPATQTRWSAVWLVCPTAQAKTCASLFSHAVQRPKKRKPLVRILLAPRT